MRTLRFFLFLSRDCLRVIPATAFAERAVSITRGPRSLAATGSAFAATRSWTREIADLGDMAQVIDPPQAKLVWRKSLGIVVDQLQGRRKIERRGTQVERARGTGFNIHVHRNISVMGG